MLLFGLSSLFVHSLFHIQSTTSTFRMCVPKDKRLQEHGPISLSPLGFDTLGLQLWEPCSRDTFCPRWDLCYFEGYILDIKWRRFLTAQTVARLSGSVLTNFFQMTWVKGLQKKYIDSKQMLRQLKEDCLIEEFINGYVTI